MPGRQSSVRHEWSEQRVSRELESWFAERAFEVWPTYRTFARGGRKRLNAAVMQTGGPQRWAVELGVPLVPHRPGPALRAREIWIGDPGVVACVARVSPATAASAPSDRRSVNPARERGPRRDRAPCEPAACTPLPAPVDALVVLALLTRVRAARVAGVVLG